MTNSAIYGVLSNDYREIHFESSKPAHINEALKPISDSTDWKAAIKACTTILEMLHPVPRAGGQKQRLLAGDLTWLSWSPGQS